MINAHFKLNGRWVVKEFENFLMASIFIRNIRRNYYVSS